jgi:chemotaxis response regulator CheB
LLAWHSGHRIAWAADEAAPQAGTVYVCPARHDMRVDRAISIRPLDRHASVWLPCPDLLFASVASAYGAGSVGIVLSGMLPVALDGLRAIRAQGGLAMVQSQKSSPFFDMPSAAIDFAKADIVLSPARIAEALVVAEARHRERGVDAGAHDE